MSEPDSTSLYERFSNRRRNRLNYSIPTSVISLVAIAFVYITFNHFIEFSGFAVSLAKIAIGLLMAALVDNFVLGRFSTLDEIKDGNLAYAVVYFGLMVIIAAGIATG